ncbi:unnamed protein product [Rhodiola kirilowii]
MSALTNEPDRLPSQTIQNPKENVNAVTLRSGRKLVVKPMEQEEDKRPEALETLEQDAAEKNEDASEEEQDATKEEGNASEERRPGPVPASEEHKEARYLEPRLPKLAQHFHFQYLPVCQNNMSWMRTCLSCSAKSKSTSPSWKPSSKFLDMLSF